MSSQSNKQESSGFKVKIKADALIRMITHVLKFGNEVLAESIEVMGICIGEINETDKMVNLNNVIPIQHGIHVSTGFTKEDLELFSRLNKEYQEKEIKIIGWYISRPGWGLDFTEITIQNHKFFQTDKNPQGFVIVFDHTLMGKEKGLGFKIYTLKELKKSNDYIEVSSEIEIPANLNFFKWVQKFMEDSQKLSPVIIKELKEQPLTELQEIPLTAEDLIEERIKDYSEQVDHIISGFSNGLSKLNEAIGITYDIQVTRWIGEVTQGTLKGIEHISKSLNQLKSTVSDGLRDVQKFFNNTFEEISVLFKKNITEYINKRVDGQKELKNEISNILNATIEESKIKINQQIQNVMKPFEEKINNVLNMLDKTSNLNSQISKLILDLNNLALDKEADIKNLARNITEYIRKVSAPFKTQVDSKFEEVDLELKPIKEGYSEIKILLEKLQKTITDFRNIT